MLVEGDEFQREAQIFAPYRQHVQYDKADQLAENGADSRAGDAHSEGECEQRHQCHVKHRARHHTHHGRDGVALKSHLIVERHGGGHDRRAEQHNA